jgi:hypothetical protein
VRSYLQISIVILGPDDKPVIHDRQVRLQVFHEYICFTFPVQKERAEELKKLQLSGGDPLAAMTITLPQVWKIPLSLFLFPSCSVLPFGSKLNFRFE